MKTLLLVSAIQFFLATPLLAEFHTSGKLPNGSYYCSMYVGTSLMSIGEIEIDGQSYRGPAFDKHFEGDHPYELTPKGVVFWKGPMGGLGSDGNAVVSTVITSDVADKAGFVITVQTKRGNFQQIECNLQ